MYWLTFSLLNDFSMTMTLWLVYDHDSNILWIIEVFHFILSSWYKCVHVDIPYSKIIISIYFRFSLCLLWTRFPIKLSIRLCYYIRNYAKNSDIIKMTLIMDKMEPEDWSTHSLQKLLFVSKILLSYHYSVLSNVDIASSIHWEGKCLDIDSKWLFLI